MGTEVKDVIVRVDFLADRRGKERTSEDILSFKSSSCHFGGIAANCPSPLVMEFLAVALEALRTSGQIENFCGNVHSRVFPNGGVKSLALFRSLARCGWIRQRH